MSRYELIEGTSRKFWDVSLHGTQLVVHWGRIGTQGQSKVFEFPTAAAAEDQQSRLIRQKTAKGYISVESTPADPKSDQGAPAKRVVKAVSKKRASSSSDKDHRPRARLKAAFAALNAMGIVALEDAGYTQSDGWDDVNEIANRLLDSGKRPRAGVFYHRQDKERGKNGEGLFLTFGSYAEQDTDADSIAVGHIVVDVLKTHGFEPEWNGMLSTRLHTGRFDWK